MAIKVKGNIVIDDDKSFQLGTGTSGERPSTPSQGRLYYNSELNKFEIYDGSIWTQFSDSNHQHSISDITDISSTDISNWNTSYNRSVTGVSGNGNGNLIINREGNNVTTDLSHSHDSSDLPSTIAYTDESNTFTSNLTIGNSNFEISTFQNSVITVDFYVESGNGVTVGNITSPQGSGTLNAKELYQDGQPFELIGYQLKSAHHIYSLDISGVSIFANRGMSWNNDGTKMYFNSQDNIYEYTLSTPFDLSTASFNQSNPIEDQHSISISLQDITWNNNGTKMFAVSFSEYVYEYTLSTAFDISTLSYNNKSVDISSEESGPTGLDWNSDGTKLNIVGKGNDNVYEYTLSTAFDISTMSYNNKSLDISSEDSSMNGIIWNNDGTKLFLCGDSNNRVYEYNLTTPFDISTALFNHSLNIFGSECRPNSLTWNNDGTKLYVFDQDSNNLIYEFKTGVWM